MLKHLNDFFKKTQLSKLLARFVKNNSAVFEEIQLTSYWCCQFVGKFKYFNLEYFKSVKLIKTFIFSFLLKSVAKISPKFFKLIFLSCHFVHSYNKCIRQCIIFLLFWYHTTIQFYKLLNPIICVYLVPRMLFHNIFKVDFITIHSTKIRYPMSKW